MDRRIRILITISNFNTAGSGKVVYDLAKGLDTSKFEVEIACGNSNGDFFKQVEALGLPIHIFQTKTHYKPYYNLLFRIWEISKFYKQNRYDLIHSWQWSNDWTEALAARMAHVKWLYTKKAMGFNNKHWHIKSYLAHFVVTINEEMRAYFPNKKEQALIPLGIDTNYYYPIDVKSKNQIVDSQFQIITVANLVPVKGIEVLLQAINILKDKTLHLTILGDYNNDYGRDVIGLVKKLNMEGQIEFVDKQLDVRPYIAKADLYVIPTLNEGRKEGMPMALVEAMAMGIPVLGSDISGINYVLKDFRDYLFHAGDFDALSKKILLLKNMTVKEREQIGKELRTYCVEHFSMKNFIARHEELYVQLVQKL